jgi:hypothetical protein
MSAKMDCPVCKGRGVVPHEKRKIGPENARIPDPADFQTEETCPGLCGGSGKVPYIEKRADPDVRG